MNKIACIFLSLGAAAGAASAQSSVTVFGVVDAAARNVRNEGAGSMSSLASGSNSTSRLGFRATEDLGDGLSASFWLESGFQADTGVSGQTSPANQFFDRRATLSLASKRWGELRAGRDFVPTYVNWGRYDPFGYVGIASTTNFIVSTQTGPIRSAFGTGPNTLVRSSNAIQYLLPGGLGGVEGGLMIAAGEGGTAANAQNRVLAWRLGYGAGAANISLASTSTKNNVTVGESFKDHALAGSYDFGVVKLSAGIRQFRFADAKQLNRFIGAVVPLGLGQVNLSVGRADLKGSVGTRDVSGNDAMQYGLGFVYNLSKRSALYATAVLVDNKGAATFVAPGGPAGIVGGGRSTGYEAGLRHSF